MLTEGKFMSTCRGCRVRGVGVGRGVRGSVSVQREKKIVKNSVLKVETSNFVNK